MMALSNYGISPPASSDLSSHAAEVLLQQNLSPPRTFTLAITSTCNLTCRHCWVEAVPSASPVRAPEKTLSRLIEEFAACGGEGVRFTGGEPLCHPAWLDLMKFVRSFGLPRVALQTNAMLMTDEQVSALRELDFPGLSLEISLDGATAEVHDLVRGKGAFEAGVAGIQRLLKGGLAPRITIAFTEMRHNLEDIPAVLELADTWSVKAVVTGTLVQCGRADNESLVRPPDPEQYVSLLKQYDTNPRFRILYQKMGSVAALEWYRHTTSRTECCTFIENPYLTPDGRMYPCLLCHTKDFSVSGVFDKSFAAVIIEGASLWSSLKQISQNRAMAIPECLKCPERVVCAGGCMGRAWGSHGNFFMADDRCEVRRAIGRHR
jgi:radical SAM protein with 4Fe4S-binding SPASM domain